MVNFDEIKEIDNLINNGSALLAVAIDSCEFNANTQMQVVLECTQKFLSEAMERLSSLW